MIKKSVIGLITIAVLFFSLQIGNLNVEASYSEPSKAVVQVYRGNSMAATLNTNIYLNKANAEKYVAGLRKNRTKATDATAFIIGFVPYFGQMYAAGYMIKGWSYSDQANKIEKLLKSNKGVVINILEGKGKASSTPTISKISGWDGKRTSLPYTKNSSSTSNQITTSVKVSITQ